MKKISISVLLLCLALTAAYSQKEKFEAIYIYNFTKKIEWPKEVSSGDFVIGVLGKSDIIAELENVASAKKVGTRTIVVKVFSDVSKIENCQILFIASNESDQLDKAKAVLADKPTLFITDKKGMAKSGSGINFLEKDGKLKFELNKDNITKQGLKISADLEKLAIIV
ncbi:MAG: YfiR family protein [Bacteroidales bacterium]|nr:YfiR family protein [Bacteroidales bacterium]MCF8456654.1 YfiR family protein [Bacteroidales bacterium]